MARQDSTRVPNGVVLWEGTSPIDGVTPIGVVATFRSNNVKTGNMIQTWILLADTEPHTALGDKDQAICGGCPLRGEGCYVTVHQAPLAVYRTWKQGGYEAYEPQKHDPLFEGDALRWGAYGDPVCIPFRLVAHLSRLSKTHTGYTHQWGVPKFWRYRRFFMASTHTEGENRDAQSRGWRTFRSKLASLPLLEGEIVCPASEEGGKRRTCLTCGACNGAGDNPKRVGIVIDVHGSPAKMAVAERTLTRLG